jgi:hypothetical protein
MGREKDRIIEEEERGWYSISRRYVCDSCVSDERLASFFREAGIERNCEYCDLTPEEAELRCVPFDDLMDVIAGGIYSEYNLADDEGMPWESAEGGYWFGEHVHDTYDLLMDIIGLDVSESVLSDILSALPEQNWCSRDFFALSLNEALSTSWSAFSETVKYETRYLFTLPSNAEEAESAAVEGEGQGRWYATSVDIYPAIPSSDLDGELDYDRQHGIPPYEMLDAIGKLVRRLRIFRAVPTGTVLYRARVHDANERFTTAAELGPPGREDASQPNRMSPVGIVMFYGTLDHNTAISETFQASREGASQKVVSVAQFETLSETLVLDLTALPPIPSIFDRTEREARHGIAFLHEFVEDLTQPIARDGTEHIEYVPTQIVTEYFRRRFLTDDGRQLQGIIYQSSQREAGIACVLFIDAYACGVPSPSLCNPGQKLRLLGDSIERIPGQVLVDLERGTGGAD